MHHSSVKITDEVYSHYSLEDLRSALGRHPLIASGLTAEQKFDEFHKEIEARFMKDKRFRVKFDSDAQSIEVKIR